jgi:lauroyl/myristoyl acyltransferase
MFGEKPVSTHETLKYPIALRAGVDLVVALSKPIDSFRVEGQSNLAELGTGTPHIIAVSHSSEFDIPLAMKALGRHLDIAITDQSSHHNPAQELGMYISLRLVGKDNFIPISYESTSGIKLPASFNPNDAEPMLKAIGAGKSIMVAAHNPITTNERGEIDPPRAGYFAAYLSALSGIPILPVGIDLVP